jgi:hypothetical protein
MLKKNIFIEAFYLSLAMISGVYIVLSRIFLSKANSAPYCNMLIYLSMITTFEAVSRNWLIGLRTYSFKCKKSKMFSKLKQLCQLR